MWFPLALQRRTWIRACQSAMATCALEVTAHGMTLKDILWCGKIDFQICAFTRFGNLRSCLPLFMMLSLNRAGLEGLDNLGRTALGCCRTISGRKDFPLGGCIATKLHIRNIPEPSATKTPMLPLRSFIGQRRNPVHSCNPR